MSNHDAVNNLTPIYSALKRIEILTDQSKNKDVSWTFLLEKVSEVNMITKDAIVKMDILRKKLADNNFADVTEKC